VSVGSHPLNGTQSLAQPSLSFPHFFFERLFPRFFFEKSCPQDRPPKLTSTPFALITHASILIFLTSFGSINPPDHVGDRALGWDSRLNPTYGQELRAHSSPLSPPPPPPPRPSCTGHRLGPLCRGTPIQERFSSFLPLHGRNSPLVVFARF